MSDSLALLSALFRYRQRENRAPLEDFVTEAFAGLLRLVQREGGSAQSSFYRTVLQIPGSVAFLESLDVSWHTQYSLGENLGRLDLAGIGYAADHRRFVLFCEIKVDAAHTIGADGVEQCERYKRAMSSRARPGDVEVFRYITHITTPPPSVAIDERLKWSNVARAIEQWLRVQRMSEATRFLAREFIGFLEEHGMTTVTLALLDVASVAPNRRLHAACREFGKVASREVRRARGVDGFALSPSTFSEPKFYGAVVTPIAADGRGEASHNAKVAIWAGAVVDNVWGISPRNPDIPELQVGFALWRFDQDPSDVLATLVELGGSALTAFEWQGWSPVPSTRGLGWWVRRKPLHELAACERPEDEAMQFFEESVNQWQSIPGAFFAELHRLSQS